MTGIEAERLEPGDHVYWNDPDEGECSREYLIDRIEHNGDMVRITEPDGSELQCFVSELAGDGEVIGLDTDGCILQWNADDGSVYNCGETLAEFGADNLTESERARLLESALQR